MLLRRFYDDKLAQASYLVGCARTGEALVVDPNRDVGQYLTAAKSERMRITLVTETHIHADFVSGSRELAARAGARLLLSKEGGTEWQYSFAAESGATLLRDGDSFMVGNIRIDVQHTPGHTPEHLTFLVTDTVGADRPMGAFTGDFIFVGDVGRPDLLERAAGYEGTMEAGARQLFASIQRFRTLPDWLQIWPAHGAGSACGKALGAVPQSTLGYEKLYNPALRFDSDEEFVRFVLEGQPEPPRYFAEMKRINRDGPSILGGFRAPARHGIEVLEQVLKRGELVVDTRSQKEFAKGHVPGTINIPLNASFTTWAGWLIPYDAPFHLIVDEMRASAIEEAVRDLAMIGLDQVTSYFGSDVGHRWRERAGSLETIASIRVGELAERGRTGEVEILDVRGRSEWEAGHLPGVRNIPLGYLAGRLDEVPHDRPVVLHCQGGSRSAIAASLLRSRGYTNVMNLEGGFTEWEKAGLPVETSGVGAEV